ncbi:MAG: biopolymer transporter ExbD [Fimbriimonadaceae bacterium]|nr:biopolymer transporter ExbD [Fimbriimonadaceae bacterium]
MKFRNRHRLKRTKIEIIPMIDTMFFLLVFFMLSSLALTRLMAMPVELPKAASSTRTQDQNLSLTIDARGNIFLDRERIGMDQLGGSIQRLASGRQVKDLTMVISADRSALHGLVVECIDKARLAGLTKFAIATQPAP